MYRASEPEYVETIIIGGGQAGLSVGYHLARLGRPFLILEANERIGDSWRKRWDSLRLFSPARFDGLDGMPFPAPAWSFPTKDEMADYLEQYAAHFALAVRTGVEVDRVSRRDGGFLVSAGESSFECDQVVVAMANYQRRRVPSFAEALDPGIVQFHSTDYRNLSQLQAGGVLLVGAGNSGSEIALEVSRRHRTWMAGRDTGHLPFRINGRVARLIVPLLFRFVFHRVLTVGTPFGRKARPVIISRGGPLIRAKPADLASASVERVPRTVGARDGRPLLEDGRVLDVANVIWCTGFDPGLSWIDLPIFDGHGEPRHERGIVAGEPGLYFVGLPFLYAASSSMIHGVGRDARRIAVAIAARSRAQRPATAGELRMAGR